MCLLYFKSVWGQQAKYGEVTVMMCLLKKSEEVCLKSALSERSPTKPRLQRACSLQMEAQGSTYAALSGESRKQGSCWAAPISRCPLPLIPTL